jgi:glycosyltransferase involved in cell wall biosynthesis
MNRSPRVSFNGRFLDQELTGVQRYSRELLSRLTDRMRVIRPSRRLSPTQGHLWEQAILPSLCRGTLLWSPGNTGPLLTANQVVTIHDASTLDHPEWFSERFATWYRFLLPRLARRARKVITVSEFSKQRLMINCSIPEDKIVTVRNAIDPRFQPSTEETKTALRQRHGLERPYCLYVGSIEPRKNVSTLLKAWERLHLKDIDLVVAGISGHVFRERGFSKLPAGVRFFGRVDDAELPTLLSAATCFIFPSLYEGFGFPPLEAMACGCPVVCSNATSLPEACGPAFNPSDPNSQGAVLYFDPANSEEMADCIARVIAMDAERSLLTRLGIKWIRQFSWERCVSQSWAVIEELVDS